MDGMPPSPVLLSRLNKGLECGMARGRHCRGGGGSTGPRGELYAGLVLILLDNSS